MRLACLQFAPSVGKVDENIGRAERVLAQADFDKLDLLVLPELALTGYNFPSLHAIQPFLERAGSGPSSRWAEATANRLGCIVTIGYPETTAPEAALLTSNASISYDQPVPQHSPQFHNFNSTITYSPNGRKLALYRKSFLYYTDETWASEGAGFFATSLDDLLNMKVTMGICMDINPYKFTAPWNAYEFANHVVNSGVDLVIMSMAWLAHEENLADEVEIGSGNDHAVGDGEGITNRAHNGATGTAQESEYYTKSHENSKPALATLNYWIERFGPVIDGNKEVVIVIANRCGREGDVTYAGTSTVMRAGKGRIGLWDVLGKGEEKLLVVDTDEAPNYVFQTQSRQDGIVD